MISLAADELGSVDAETAPFLLSLVIEGSGQSRDFHCLEVLRVLPGRRLVVRVSLDGEPLVLKLFLGSGRARYLERERRGLEWLAALGLPSASLHDSVRGKNVDGLLLGYLPDAVAVSPDEEVHLQEIARLLARLHEGGLHHRDLHLDNFVANAAGVHAIDGDGIRRWRGASVVPLSEGLDELAVLAVQRPPAEDEAAAVLVQAYLEARDVRPSITADFHSRIARARRGRLERYARKAQRNCSEYAVVNSFRSRSFCVRGIGEDLLTRLADPDLLFAAGEVLKSGNSATVIRVAGPVPFVVKRFNIKSPAHGVRRMLRFMPRYRRAWVSGQLLHFLNIPTARPLVLLEQRFGPLRGVAYLVQEDLKGEHLLAEVISRGLTDARCNEVTRLFCLLKRVGLSHGDTKATNFVIHEERLHLIDLDAMRLDASGSHGDVQRFLDNWPAAETARFRASFVKAGLL